MERKKKAFAWTRVRSETSHVSSKRSWRVHADVVGRSRCGGPRRYGQVGRRGARGRRGSTSACERGTTRRRFGRGFGSLGQGWGARVERRGAARSGRRPHEFLGALRAARGSKGSGRWVRWSIVMTCLSASALPAPFAAEADGRSPWRGNVGRRADRPRAGRSSSPPRCAARGLPAAPRAVWS